MIARSVASILAFCLDHARFVVAAGVALAIVCSAYAAFNFRMNSDIDALLPTNTPWRQQELAFERAFERFQLIEVVVEAPTPELASAATAELTSKLDADKTRFRAVADASASSFFARHGLLYPPLEQLRRSVDGLVEGEPIIHDLAADRSLRGLVAGLEDALLGLQSKRLAFDDLARPLDLVGGALDEVLAGKPASFSWRALVEGESMSAVESFGFIEVRPILDFKSLEPGKEAEDAIHRIAAPIAAQHQAAVRLTGPIPIDDEQFGSIKEDAVRNGVLTAAAVLIILWLALRSLRLIAALIVNLVVGLAATAGLGLLLVGTFNLISIYFAVLFVGIGVDFAIQFSVRYRDERHRRQDLREALLSASGSIATPLSLAALATAAGFFSFLPTEYKGVSELGTIAGAGMLIAFLTSMTMLPALIFLADPPGEPEPLGYAFLAPLDEYLARRRRPILIGTIVIVACALPSLYWLKFDFNPLDLQKPTSEAISTYRALQRNPSIGANAIQALAPSLEEADAVAASLRGLPQVLSVTTLSTFIPTDQNEKLPLIERAAEALAGAFDAKEAQPAPSDAENVDALKEGAERLLEAAAGQTGAGPQAARRLSALMVKLADASPETRDRATRALVWPLDFDLEALRASLAAQPVTRQTLPRGLVDDWVAPDGQARVSIAPRANPNDSRAMRAFAQAVLAVEPNATEGPIATIEAGDMILRAFIQAGAWALASIAVLLLLALRRVGDVMLTLAPLALAGLVTMELMSLIGLAFNFANIIALPLLLGVGVAFKIYYIMAWREGVTHLLQTPLSRAVFFSALTTATAFGSLWLSSNLGVSSMGKLLALSLVCTLAAAVLFQPILMGKPRNPARK